MKLGISLAVTKMDIDGYLHSFAKSLNNKQNIVKQPQVCAERVGNFAVKVSAKLSLIYNMCLHIKETFATGNCSRKECLSYSYEFLDAKGENVIRWDNVPYHPESSVNGNEHKHVGSGETQEIIPEARPSIGKVFRDVDQCLLSMGIVDSTKLRINNN